MPPLPLAAADFESVMGMGIGFCMFVVVPIVFMLLQHQRRMAELLRDRNSQTSESVDRRLESMERRLEELGYRVNDAVLRNEDRFAQGRETPPPVEDLHRRLNS